MKISFLASGAPKAQEALKELLADQGSHKDPATADVVVALGGDGFMLDVLHGLENIDTPVYGMNRGTVGFLMNEFDRSSLISRIEAAREQVIHPLSLRAFGPEGEIVHEALAFNEVSILRKGPQAANLRIKVNGHEQMANLVCDGAILATPAGSTAYNSSAHGPILPIDANVLALTPIAAFRPRRWRGAVLPASATVTFEPIDAEKRPVMVNADSRAFDNVTRAEVRLSSEVKRRLLFDPGHGLEDRILREQFI